MTAGIPFPDISPEIFTIQLFGASFALRWYAMAYIVGILLGWRLAVMAVTRPGLWAGDSAPMTREQVEDLLTAIILGVIIGGRLGYVMFYRPGYYIQNPLEIAMLWQGGMAFHGGFLGVVVAVWLVARKHGVRLGDIANLVALAAPPAIFLVRIANFINAELWGRPTGLPWGVIFPGAAAQDCPGVEGLCARHPSQLYEAGLEGLLLGLLLIWLAFVRGWLKSRWSLAGLFFAGYGTARFLVEFVRQPDAQFVGPGNPVGLAFHVDGIGLTMGQTLSLPMIVVGLAVMLWALRGAPQAKA
ncbi:MAG: prolipoprotein diacylglyceryl transferase [Salibaculum sp.]|jgi:phosphatidylglycerol:prolipoprotein diacylglycerol transferase|uniref:prolipoprotein diacylglyceryl transferase n=1 Tax=Roseovarius halophilus (ex Wu et al. 2025) TaxID=3376060 RepID=UPI0028709AD1|nr:prolipoprotein diacylglyceryl transferase [Salibaculum sp.]MDR9427293.1 prolipoprotein diacylglyceryl transferase [Salibaculum sp.]MDR9481739.1 prolipoprotein diacylglyceryl transferase [Salibaculum sp.]